MSTQSNKLTVLQENKTLVFYSPIEGRDVLVRTGITENNSVIHAILYTYSKDYILLSKKDREKYVDKLIDSLSDKINKKRWEEISNGIVVQLPFEENIKSIISTIYKYIDKQEEEVLKNKKIKDLIVKADLETYKVLLQLVPQDQIKKEIFERNFKSNEDKNIEEIKKSVTKDIDSLITKVLKELGNELEYSKKKTLKTKFISLFSSILERAEKNTFRKYCKNIKNSSLVVDPYTIELLCEKFNRNIYFINADNRLPYKIIENSILKHKKSIILLWLGGNRYEAVGRLLTENKIQREFETSDTLVKCVNTFVYEQDKILDEYPALIPFLPKKVKSEDIVDEFSSEDESKDSRSNSESDSDSEDSRSESEDETDSSSRSKSSKSPVKEKRRDKSSKSPVKEKRRDKSSKSPVKEKRRDKSSKSPVKEKRRDRQTKPETNRDNNNIKKKLKE
jgi:hypothetical protein